MSPEWSPLPLHGALFVIFVEPASHSLGLEFNVLRDHVERESFLNLRCEVKHGDNAGAVGSDFQRIGRMIGEIV